VNYQPDWSPDGRRIAFTRAVGGGIEVWVMNADGGDQRPVTSGAVDQDPVWSPDGSRIAFARGNEIYVVAARGGAPRNLTRHSSADSEPCWSPDGSLIGFTSDRGGSPDIWTMRADGTGARRLTEAPATDTHCEWQRLPPRRPGDARPGTGALRLRVRPRRARSGRRTTFRLTVTRAGDGAPVRRARIGFAGRTARTNPRGRARIRVVLRAPGRRIARASFPGSSRARFAVRVARPR
jgi:hypothetical protein